MNSQEVTVSIDYKRQNWRAARLLVIALALGVWFTGAALAQSAIHNRASKSASSEAADPPAAPTGIDAGNYNIQGSLTFGWRYSNISGSQANYDTFVNLQQGPRLLNFSFNAHSLNHKGSLFDNMAVTGFGFGGDPVDVVRLNMTKNRWYDFNATYRRYKYFWNYNLLANPLNPSNSVPAVPILNSPHLMDLSHRMTDLQLRLLPQSAVHVRLGYSHSGEHGPSFTSDGAAAGAIDELGATALLYQNFKTTEDNYDIGVDFDLLPRTTLSYDEFIQHYKEDTSATDGNLNYQVQLPNGSYVPVDLGLVFNTASGTPCANPVTNPNTTPPTTGGVCEGNILATHNVRPRATIPTERFAFQTTYFRNLNMTGQISYSSGSQTINNPINYNSWIGVNTRYDGIGSSDTATTKAKRIIVNGDWNAVYDVTAKFRVMDSFNYNNFRIPGILNLDVINYFAPPGGFSLQGAALVAQNPSQYLFSAASCPPPFTGPTCPQHNSTEAGPDLAAGYEATYYAQDFRSNTFELSYDFTPKVGAHIGYRYTKRIITDLSNGAGDFSKIFYSAETYDPGGSAGAFRGDCAHSGAVAPGGSFPVYYTGTTTQRGVCTVQADSSVVFTGIGNSAGLPTYLQEANIDGNSALFGLWVRPASNFRTSFNLELFSADQSFTRITPRLLRHYQINSTYTPVRWADITGVIDIVDSSNDVTEVQNKEHNRSYSISTTFMPNSRFSLDLFYNYNDVYTQALDCYTVGFGPLPAGAAACPFAASPVPVAAISTYSSKSNYAGADMMVKPVKQLTFTLGYSGSFVRGTPSWFNPLSSYSVPFLNLLTPYGPLRYNYQQPYLTMNWDVYKGFSYTASWNYYGYNSRGNNNPVGLAPLGTQDFNGNNMTMSARYAF